jgi:hypothetical protein
MFRITKGERNALSYIYKSLVAAAGLAGQAIAFGLIHGTALHVTSLVLAGLTLVGVYRVPNAPLPVKEATADLEARIAQLEAAVPGLDDLAQAMGHVVAEGLKRVIQDPSVPAVPVVVNNLSTEAAPEEPEPEPDVPAETHTDEDQAAAQAHRSVGQEALPTEFQEPVFPTQPLSVTAGEERQD